MNGDLSLIALFLSDSLHKPQHRSGREEQESSPWERRDTPYPTSCKGGDEQGGGGGVLRGRKPQAVWVVVHSPRCLWGRIGILEGKMGEAGGWEGSPDPCLQQCSSAKVYSWPIPWVCWSSASVPPSADVPLSTHSLVFLLAPSCRTGTLALGCVTLWCVRGH